MARLTLRIPDSLHARLAERARREGVSMNQYVVFALSRITTADELTEQRRDFASLLHRHPLDEAEEALSRLLAERR
jgi:hypothetical protein